MQPWLGTTITPYYPELANQIPALQVEGENVRYTWSNAPVEARFERQGDTFPLSVYVNGERYAPVHTLTASLRATIVGPDRAAARAGIDAVMIANRLEHEIYCDWCWALLTLLRDTFGEENFGRVMRATMEDWIATRYKDMVDMSPEELLQISVEGLRGEYLGSELLGDVEVTEEADRYVLAFDPCGTGGRMRRGVPQLGTPSRTEAPYNFGVSREAHDWELESKGRLSLLHPLRRY